MKRITTLLTVIMILAVCCGCALGYLPEAPAKTTAVPTGEPVVLEVDDAEAPGLAEETPGPPAAGENEEIPEPLPAAKPAEALPVGTEQEVLRPDIADTGAIGVLYATEIPYGYDFSSETEWLCYDFDADGSEETVFTGPIDTETDCLSFRVGETAEETEIFVLTEMAIIRLTERGVPKLFVCGDFGSDDYITYVFGVGTDAIVCEDMIEARLKTEDEVLYFCERYECLGTREGIRAYAGDPPAPVSDTLIPAYIPTEEDLTQRRDELTETGILLRSKVDLPARAEDGTETLLPKGTSLYLVFFTETLDRIGVKTEEGALFVMDTKLPNGGWVLTVNGLPEDMCFSNLSYAD